MRTLRALLTLLRCCLQLLSGVLTIAKHFNNASLEQRGEHIAHWARGMLQILGVQLRIQGIPVNQGPMLVVMNHISWLDILVLLAAQPVCFVSKAEVHQWPVIGWLATNAGTLYIERASRRDAMRVVHQVADALRSGALIAIFPEGTTSDGRSVLPFHGNLLQAAISTGSSIQPVALSFLDAYGQRSLTPAFVGDDSLLSSIWRVLQADPITAQLDFLEPVSSAQQERRALARHLQQLIQTRLDQVACE